MSISVASAVGQKDAGRKLGAGEEFFTIRIALTALGELNVGWGVTVRPVLGASLAAESCVIAPRVSA